MRDLAGILSGPAFPLRAASAPSDAQKGTPGTAPRTWNTRPGLAGCRYYYATEPAEYLKIAKLRGALPDV